jgi:pantothenate kinase
MDTILQRLKLKKKNFSYKNLVEQSFSKHAKNNPDLLVSDIYGPNSSAINLPPNMLAASLGKLSKTNP